LCSVCFGGEGAAPALLIFALKFEFFFKIGNLVFLAPKLLCVPFHDGISLHTRPAYTQLQASIIHDTQAVHDTLSHGLLAERGELNEGGITQDRCAPR